MLSSILSPQALKIGLPSIDSLLNNPFFSSVVLNIYPTDRAHLKIPSSTKDQLKIAQACLEERLKDEQKMIRNQKRLVKVQELMSSEEEKKKHRYKLVRKWSCSSMGWMFELHILLTETRTKTAVEESTEEQAR